MDRELGELLRASRNQTPDEPLEGLPFEGWCKWHGKSFGTHNPQEEADDEKRMA